ncbi:MAG: transketolase C-terminal domain-containing protein, partial [Pseudomonadota bacterium]
EGDARIGLGEVGVFGEGADIAIVTYGNGYYLSRQAERILKERHNIAARIIDLRWLAPLPAEALLAATAPCGKVLIVDECRKTGSQSEALMALFTEQSSARAARLTAEDCFIATGPAYGATLPSRNGIVEAALALIGGDKAEPRT